LPSNKANASSVDVLLAFDQLVGGNDATVRTMSAEHTAAIVNTAAVPTGGMVVNPERPFPAAEVAERISTGVQRVTEVDAQRIVRGLLGDDSTINVFMLGVAAQACLLPVGVEYLERAITLNGTAVKKNIAAFTWGRAWVADPHATEHSAGIVAPDPDEPLVPMLTADLAAYQSQRYAARFTAVVERVAAAGHDDLTAAVARHLHKLMAYKDEYEVARLMLLPSARAQAESVGGRRTKVTWMLHPPALRAVGWKQKVSFGGWSRPAFLLLRAMRRLRGTPFDVFGWAHVRRVEQAMVPEYIAAVDALLAHVSEANLTEAIAIAALPDRVRGYEHLKLERAAAYREELSRRVADFIGQPVAATL
jgi:indolepyruvate ferredoxin oxidoreductase